MMINENFNTIQGEGKFTGYPVLFIRLSGCNLKCNFCDTPYHVNGKEHSVEEVAKIISDSNQRIIVFTGGEPLLQFDEIKEVMKLHPAKIYHLETNGRMLKGDILKFFEYISCSPKSEADAINASTVLDEFPKELYDIKVVTDCHELNQDLIPYATMLMPLTTADPSENLKIEQSVWNFCVHNHIKFCLRVHTHVWGLSKRGI